MLHDLRLLVRSLRATPVVSIAAIASIALGVGLNTAIFSLVNTVLLTLMPVADPASLVLLRTSNGRTELGSSFPYPFYRQLAESDTALAGVICRAFMGPSVEAGGPAERVSGELVSSNYFEVLGVKPHLGRLFTADDNRAPGGGPRVVLSYGYWQRRFGGDPLIVGQTIRVNTHAMTIIGVTPPSFHGLELGASPDIRVPMAMQAEMHASRSRLESPRDWWLEIIGRLEPGVSREAAAQELDAAFQRFSTVLPSDWLRDRRLVLLDGSRGQPTLQNRFAKPLVVLNAFSMAVLFLVCLNVANLMLARTAARRRELSLRMALGAGRGRLVAQLLVEALLIATTGGALGLLLAWWGARALAGIAVPAAAGPAIEVAMDLRVLAFAAALSVATGVVCGLAPALFARRTSLVAALSTEGRGAAAGRLLGRKLLIASQIAVSFMLLVGAGLFARTLANLRYLDFGFDTDHLLLLTLDPSLSASEQPRIRLFYDDVATRVAALPGVRSASFAMMPLLGRNTWGSGLRLDTGVLDNRPGPGRNAVGPGYFSTIGTPIVAGREFADADIASGQKVAVVNESFARRYFGGAALGRRIGPGGPQGSAEFTIVGIARDGKYAQVRETLVPFWYVPYQQLAQVGQLTLHVRTTGDPEAATAAVRHAIAAIDKRVVVFGVKTMGQQISDQLILERLLARLAAGFATLAVLLAALGLYGVTTYATMARIREIGVRIALGATPPSIFALVFRQTALLIVVGLTVGLALAAAGAGYLRSLLFGLEPADPLVMSLAALAVAAVTAFAAWLPARRATRTDPVAALQ